MSASQSKRPRFYEDQFLGSNDLTALIDYERVARARHDLGAHVWGIAMGLQLLEMKSKSGGEDVDVFIQPGYAWDGFGRPIVILAPFKLPAAFFTMAYDSLVDDADPKGRLVEIWIKYCETPVDGPQSGFEVCVAEDQYSRIYESFRVDVGAKASHASRHDSVTVAGRSADAAQILQKVGAADAPLLEDESVPYQDFPEDHGEAVWFLSLGVVRWRPNPVASLPGSFIPLTADDKVQSDRRRRYIGAVAETLNAPRGFVRVRDRALGVEPKVWSDDRLWVEGMLRVDGDAKILNGVLAFRNASNSDLGTPLTIGRLDGNSLGGYDMQVQIGAVETGLNRIVAGPRVAGKVKEGLVVTDAGSVGIGVGSPEKPLTIRAQRAGEELIGFQAPSGTLKWHINQHVGGKAGLNVSESGVQDGRLFIQPGGNVGLLTTEPTNALHVNANSGIRQNRLHMSGGGDGMDHWSSVSYNAYHNPTNSDWTFPDPSRKAVTIEMDDTGGKPRFEVWSTTDASKTSFLRRLAVEGESGNVILGLIKGNLGVGAPAPDHKLELNIPASADPIKGMSIDVTSFTTGMNAAASHFFRVRDIAAPSTPFFIRGDGRVGVGTDAPGAQLHATQSCTVGPYGVSTGMGSLNVSGAGAEVGLVSRALTSWPAATPATGDRFVWYNPNGNARLWADGDLLTVTNDGKLGIATNEPKCKLHVVGSQDGDADLTESHIACIENISTGGSADVLELKVHTTDPEYSCNWITFSDVNYSLGSIEGLGGPGGIVFHSGSGDYAEWLPRLNADEVLTPGDVVGVFGGRVSKKTDGADQVLAISTYPIVLGNRQRENAHLYEKVGFIGQLPIKVRGAVRAGDYILASREGDGVGTPVQPAEMEPQDFMRVVGAAWETSDESSVKLVRAAVGLSTPHAWGAVVSLIRQLRRDLDALTSTVQGGAAADVDQSAERTTKKSPSRQRKST